MPFIYGLAAALPLAAKGSTGQKVSGFGAYGMWIMIALMVVVFYFLLIRPQRKKAAQHDEMVTQLKKGDEVVTIGGIHGVIKRIEEDSIVLEVDKGVKITFARSAISRSVTEPEPEEEEEEAQEAEEEQTEEKEE